MTTGKVYAFDEKDAFVYVFDKEVRDELIKEGFRLLVNDEKKDVYVFANQPEMAFSLHSVNHIKSSTLSF